MRIHELRSIAFVTTLCALSGCGQEHDTEGRPTVVGHTETGAQASGAETAPELLSPNSDCAEADFECRDTSSACVNIPPEFPMHSLDAWDEEVIGDLLACQSNEDCTFRDHGYCTWVANSQLPASACSYGCEVDADCGDGSVCDCGVDVGQCVQTRCRGSEDCNGNPCVRIEESSGCVEGYVVAPYYDCAAPEGCVSDADCGAGEVCTSITPGLEQVDRHCRRPAECGL